MTTAHDVHVRPATVADHAGRLRLWRDYLASAERGAAVVGPAHFIAHRMGAAKVHWLTHETNAQAMLLCDRLAGKPGFVQYRIVL